MLSFQSESLILILCYALSYAIATHNEQSNRQIRQQHQSDKITNMNL